MLTGGSPAGQLGFRVVLFFGQQARARTHTVTQSHTYTLRSSYLRFLCFLVAFSLLSCDWKHISCQSKWKKSCPFVTHILVSICDSLMKKMKVVCVFSCRDLGRWRTPPVPDQPAHSSLELDTALFRNTSRLSTGRTSWSDFTHRCFLNAQPLMCVKCVKTRMRTYSPTLRMRQRERGRADPPLQDSACGCWFPSLSKVSE